MAIYVFQSRIANDVDLVSNLTESRLNLCDRLCGTIDVPRDSYQTVRKTPRSKTDGFDLEWPIWYADFLLDRLLPLLEASMTRSELIYLLVHLSKIQPADAPGAKWSRYYARYLAERYL